MFRWWSRSRKGDADRQVGLDGILFHGKPFADMAKPRLRVCAVWSRHTHGLTATLDVGGEDRAVGGTFALGRVFVHVAVEEVFTRAFAQRCWAWAQRTADSPGGTRQRNGTWAHDLYVFNHGRETGVRCHDGIVWLDVWHNSMGSWHSDRRELREAPWYTAGWEWTFHWFDRLFGGTSYAKEPGTWHDAEVELAGQRVPLRVHLYRCKWSRRWPWVGRWLHRFDVSVAGHDFNDPLHGTIQVGRPPMFAGKGENSYDQDDDAIYVAGSVARQEAYTVADAVEHYRASYERERARRGPARERVA